MTVRERRPPLSSHPALNQIGRQRGKTIVVPLRAAILDRYIPRMKADRGLWRWMIRLWAPSPGARAAGDAAGEGHTRAKRHRGAYRDGPA